MARARATESRVRSRLTIAALVALASAGALAVAACSSSSSSPAPPANGADASSDTLDADTGAPLDDAGCALPGHFGSSKCDTCVQDHCCAELGACAADEGCAARSTCILGCIPEPDASGCAAACRSRTRDDAGRWSALEKCAYFSDPCAFECSISPQH